MLPFGYVLYKYQELDSTNSEALRLLRNQQIRENTIITATHQTAGRGRNGKEWVSPNGNLYMTIVIKQEMNINLLTPQLSFIAALGVGKALKKVNIKYKWPNDLMVEDKKISGILLETHEEHFIIIGVGININHAPDYATYLRKYHEVDIETLTNDIVRNFQYEKEQWKCNGFSKGRESWLNNAWRLHNTITINFNNTNLTGTMCGIDQQGRLILKTEQDTYHINSGSIYT